MSDVARWYPEDIRARNGADLGCRYVSERDYDALRAERDELIGMREEVLHYQREFHRLRDERDEAVALLRSGQNKLREMDGYSGANFVDLGIGIDGADLLSRIDAFLAKVTP